jgi:hypothetical protein
MDVNRDDEEEGDLRVVKRPHPDAEEMEGGGDDQWEFREYPSGRLLTFRELFSPRYRRRLWLVLKPSITPYQLALLMALGAKELNGDGTVVAWANAMHVWSDMVKRDFPAAWYMYAQQDQAEEGGEAMEGMREYYWRHIEGLSQKPGQWRRHTLWKRAYEFLTRHHYTQKPWEARMRHFLKEYPRPRSWARDPYARRFALVRPLAASADVAPHFYELVNQNGGAALLTEIDTLRQNYRVFDVMQNAAALNVRGIPVHICAPSIAWRKQWGCNFNRDIAFMLVFYQTEWLKASGIKDSFVIQIDRVSRDLYARAPEPYESWKVTRNGELPFFPEKRAFASVDGLNTYSCEQSGTSFTFSWGPIVGEQPQLVSAPVCASCQLNVVDRVCGQCGVIAYCSERCASQHWVQGDHHRECTGK